MLQGMTEAGDGHHVPRQGSGKIMRTDVSRLADPPIASQLVESRIL
jgi:hypothetical protein